MKFAHIEMLFLIWAVPVLLLVYVIGMKRRQRILTRFATVRGLAAVAPDASGGRRRLQAALILISMLGLSLALTGPQYGFHWQEIQRRGIEMIVALDCSRSMLAEDIAPNRLERAKREVFDLLGMLQGDKVGLVAFAGTAFLQCPLTVDYEAFHIFLNALSPDYLPVGGTDIAGAIQTALNAFDAKTSADRAIILITDGESTGSDPIVAAQAASKAGVKLFCIGVGSDSGVPIQDTDGSLRKDAAGNIVLTRLDETTLKKMTALTGGTYVRSVAGDMDLDTIYKDEIRGHMQANTLTTGRKQVWEDRFQWFLGLALLALILDMFVPSVKKPKVMALLFLMLILPVSGRAAGVQESMRQGWAAYDKGDFEKALKHFIDAQLENPDKPEIYYNIGNAYYRLGDYEAARRNFNEAAKSQDKELKHKSLYNMGNTDFRMGKHQDAITDYEDALKIAPDDQEAQKNIEFVKKVIEQQKQQKQNQQQHQDQQKDQKGSDQKDKDQKDQNQKDQEQKDSKKQEDSQKNGDQQRNQQQPSDKDQQQAAKQNKPEDEKGDNSESAGPPPEPKPQGSDAQKPESDQAGQAAKAKPGDENEEKRKQAQRLLNRLQDKPGAAMMPAYEKRQVEKDW